VQEVVSKLFRRRIRKITRGGFGDQINTDFYRLRPPGEFYRALILEALALSLPGNKCIVQIGAFDGWTYRWQMTVSRNKSRTQWKFQFRKKVYECLYGCGISIMTAQVSLVGGRSNNQTYKPSQARFGWPDGLGYDWRLPKAMRWGALSWWEHVWVYAFFFDYIRSPTLHPPPLIITKGLQPLLIAPVAEPLQRKP
jgi:hypothetical protein